MEMGCSFFVLPLTCILRKKKGTCRPGNEAAAYSTFTRYIPCPISLLPATRNRPISLVANGGN